MYNKKAVKCYEAGRVFQRKGKLPDAERAYKKAIKINQDFVEAHTNLGNVLLNRGRLKEAFNSHRKALKLVPGHPMLLNNPGNALRGLGKAYEDIGEYQKSMQFVLQATRLKRASFDYSISESEELFRNINATFSLEFFSDRKGMGNPEATPVFILGLPRSGTSLVE